MTYQQIIQFIQDQYGTSNFIPLHAPVFQGKEKEYLLETIDSTYVSSVGTFVDKFENFISQFTGTKKAVAIVNGTSALQVGLRLVGVNQGDEVLTQALTFVATANAIAYNGAKPVFLDVDRDTMGLSPIALDHFLEKNAELRKNGAYNKITGNRIAACLPMHSFGFMARIDELIRICNKWAIPLVEDAAEALGSTFQNKQAGSFGKIGTFSFNGNKIITCGGGGAIVTNDEQLGQLGKHITTTAKIPHSWEFNHDQLGYNFRMPNLNAALACAQLEQLNTFLESKRQLFESYKAFFANDDSFHLKLPILHSRPNFWLNCIELPNKPLRDEFLKTMNENGIMTRPVWNLMYKLPMYKDCQRDDQKNAELLESRIVNIPSSVPHKY